MSEDENWQTVVQTARKKRLNRGLATLASWCQSRRADHHDDKKTLTMLERKSNELRRSVNRAGWKALEKLAQGKPQKSS